MDVMVLATQQWVNATYMGNPGYYSTPIPENGETGWTTIYALTRALQIELGISPTADSFGPTTYAECPTLSIQSNPSLGNNFNSILQGALWCKGYGTGASTITGNFYSGTQGAVMQFQDDAGVTSDGVVTPMIFKALLNMDAFVLVNGGDVNIRSMQQRLNSLYNAYTGIMPCDGIYSRETNTALIYAFQAAEGLPTSIANGNFGPTTQADCPTISSGSSLTNFIYILQYALYVNGYNPNGFDGAFGNGVLTAVEAFQAFAGLGVDGVVGKQTWMSLLVSTGDPTRKGTACDCAAPLTADTAQTLAANGYKYVGRYLTGSAGSGTSAFSKALTQDEVQIIFDASLNLFLIYEDGNPTVNYFTGRQGVQDAQNAVEAAHTLGIPDNAIIYFAVDYDATSDDIPSILQYFSAVNGYFTIIAVNYRVGIYGTRNVCTQVRSAGYSQSSFVSDMSTGYSGNLGFSLPTDWAFDQISTVTEGSGSGSIEIDNDIASGRDVGITTVSPQAGTETSEGETIIVYQSSRLPGPTATPDSESAPDGSAPDMLFNDKSKEDINSLNSNYTEWATTYDSQGLDTLKQNLYDLVEYGTTGSSNDTNIFYMAYTAQEMFDHFLDGTGTDYRSQILNIYVFSDPSTQNYMTVATQAIIDYLKANQGDPNGAISDNTVQTTIGNVRPAYNSADDLLNGLTLCINDTWGNYIELKNYSCDGSTFSGTLRFTIYDHFGLDDTDASGGDAGVNLTTIKAFIIDHDPGFGSWYVLQRYTGCQGQYKPFVDYMEVETKISGNL